jgi:cytochrome c-type biogenesis protein CcmE
MGRRRNQPDVTLSASRQEEQAARFRGRTGVIKRQKRYLIGGVVLLLGLAYLAFTVTRASAVYYLTVPELYARGSAAGSRDVRVSGVVDAGSIQRDPATFETRFTASDQGGSLPVAYHGPVPDIFQPGIQVVVEGKLGADGVFHADTLLTKCPAHFQAATPMAAASH